MMQEDFKRALVDMPQGEEEGARFGGGVGPLLIRQPVKIFRTPHSLPVLCRHSHSSHYWSRARA